MHIRTFKGIAAVGLLIGAAALAACGSDDDGAASTDPASTEADTSAGTAAPGTAGGGEPAAGTCAPEDVTLIGQVRNETNPYEKAWLDGGDTFAESVGLTQKRLTYGGDSQKQQDQIRQELSAGGTECFVLNVLPNGDADTAPIVAATDEAGAFLVTQWNKPAELIVADYDTWASHITYDGVDSGQQIADAMFEAMGGTGGIVALQGILDTGAAKDRYAGLEAALAENPDIVLLDQQTANFSRAEALTVMKTLITKHGDEIRGVWTANDDMALGAIEALEAAGMEGVAVVGIDAVPEAVAAVGAGTMTATVSSDGPWQGGIGLAIGYCAAIGEIDITALPPLNRAFYAAQTLITADNAAEYATPTVDPAEFACDKVFERAVAPLS
jgi:ribose transport system substrate-binding protein